MNRRDRRAEGRALADRRRRFGAQAVKHMWETFGVECVAVTNPVDGGVEILRADGKDLTQRESLGLAAYKVGYSFWGKV